MGERAFANRYVRTVGAARRLKAGEVLMVRDGDPRETVHRRIVRAWQGGEEGTSMAGEFVMVVLMPAGTDTERVARVRAGMGSGPGKGNGCG